MASNEGGTSTGTSAATSTATSARRQATARVVVLSVLLLAVAITVHASSGFAVGVWFYAAWIAGTAAIAVVVAVLLRREVRPR